MNLDELHKVMRGEITLDQACEGMTDDFEIGHVSHRADGDYRKVAQGKWVPVKAGGQGHMAASEKPAEQKGEPAVRNVDHALRVIENSGGKIKGWAGWDDGFVVETENKTYQFKKGPNGYTQTDATMSLEEAKAKERQAHNAKGEQQGGGTESGPEKIEGLSDRWTIGHDTDSAGNMRYTLYDNGKSLVSSPDKDSIKSIAKMWAEKNEPKAEGGKRELKRNANGTPIYETPDDVIYDMVENYNELDRGDLQGVIEAAAMSHGWDENEILEEVDRQATEKYGLGVDSAPPRLTRDTKIRLSKIKREQTQDKTYNVGETSQRKDGLYKKVAPGKWAPVKGGGASAPAGGNSRTDGGLVWRSPDNKHRIHKDNSSGKTKYTLYERGDNYSRIIGEYDSPEAAVAAGEKINAPAGGKAEVNPITGKPLRPETVAYAKQKKAEAEQKRNTEKTAGGFTLAQNDKIKNAATDVIFKRRGEKLTPADLQREYNMSEPEANEASRRINEYFSSLEKDRQEFAKAGEKKAQNAKPQASPMAGTKKTYYGRGLTKGHTYEAEKVGDKFVATHTYPDGRQVKSEISQKDYDKLTTSGSGNKEPKYYEDLGDLYAEKKALRDKTKDVAEQKKLTNEMYDIQRKMDKAPFGYEKSDSVKRKRAWQNIIK